MDGFVLHLVGLLLSILLLFTNVICDCPQELVGCTCTPTTVSCIDTNLSNSSVIEHVPVTATTVIFRGNQFTELISNLFGSCKRGTSNKPRLQLTHLDLSNNNISTIHGQTFHCIPNLKTLILKDNIWNLDGRKKLHVFSNLSSLVNLDLENAFATTNSQGQRTFQKLADIFIFSGKKNVTGLKHLQQLNLARNGFWSISADAKDSFCAFSELLHLNLSHNDITEIDLNNCTHNLTILDLSNMRLSSLYASFIATLDSFEKLTFVDLRGNSYDCNCHLVDFYDWLKKTKVLNGTESTLRCYSGYMTSYEKQPILNLEREDLKCGWRNHEAIDHAVVGIICVLVALLCIMLFTLVYLNRNKLKIGFQILRDIPPDHMSSPKHQGYSSVQDHAV